METFSALLALCAGNSPVTGEFPSQRPVSRSFAVFFDLRLNKRLSKQSWGWWFEAPSRSLCREWKWSCGSHYLIIPDCGCPKGGSFLSRTSHNSGVMCVSGGLVAVGFTRILKGHFTGSKTSLWLLQYPRSTWTPKNMGTYITYITWLRYEVYNQNDINHGKTMCIFN